MYSWYSSSTPSEQQSLKSAQHSRCFRNRLMVCSKEISGGYGFGFVKTDLGGFLRSEEGNGRGVGRAARVGSGGEGTLCATSDSRSGGAEVKRAGFLAFERS